MDLYHSPWGLLDFQAEGVARSYTRGSDLVVWETGLGKSHGGMALAALLFEDQKIDLCLLVCESNKMGEWVDDFAEFTKLSAKKYHGASRKKVLDGELPHVLVSTYETVKIDVAKRVKGKSKRSLEPGPLMDAIEGKRCLVIYDEATKLKTRTSGNYIHHEWMLRQLRKGGETRVIALTATPIERDPENIYNIARLVYPGFLTVEQFERDHIIARDIYDRPVGFKNISRDDHSEPWVDPLMVKIAPFMQVKRKTDPDVVDQFPEQVEEFTYVEADRTEAAFYKAVDESLHQAAETETDEMALFLVLRQIAAHPASILSAKGRFAQQVVEQVGEAGIRSIPSARLGRVMDYVTPIVQAQGAQVVIFTYFGQSVLPIIHEALLERGVSVSLNHGGMTQRAREDSKRAFQAGETNVFLSSDAGRRGINLPAASYIVNYELPLTHSDYLQRINRIHRLGSKHEIVTCRSFIASGTIEEAIVGLNIKRNVWSDSVVLSGEDGGTTSHVSAAERKAIIELAREKVQPTTRERSIQWAV